jgi:hypothetical protein
MEKKINVTSFVREDEDVLKVWYTTNTMLDDEEGKEIRINPTELTDWGKENNPSLFEGEYEEEGGPDENGLPIVEKFKWSYETFEELDYADEIFLLEQYIFNHE